MRIIKTSFSSGMNLLLSASATSSPTFSSLFEEREPSKESLLLSAN